MKRLTIIYNDKVIHDGDVEEFTWTDAPGVVQVTGKAKRTSGGGLLELLNATRKAKAQAAENQTVTEEAL